MSSKGSNGMYADHDNSIKISAEGIIEKIDWKKSVIENETLGYIHGNLMFIIERKGKRLVRYTLKSYPFHNEVFTRANNYKKLSTVPESELHQLKEYAQNVFNSYVKLFLNKEVI